jgi:hypothetical protein
LYRAPDPVIATKVSAVDSDLNDHSADGRSASSTAEELRLAHQIEAKGAEAT